MQEETRVCGGEGAVTRVDMLKRWIPHLQQGLKVHTELLIQHHLHQCPPVESHQLHQGPLATAAEH